MKRFIFLLTVTILLLSSVCLLAAEPVKPGPRDRCPVCGMFVAPYPAWIAQIEFNDGSRVFFDGAKDMFKFYLNLPAEGEGHSRKTIAGIYVTEYYSAKAAAADTLLYVVGSDVLGPMGKELIPVAGKKAAQTFARDHAGRTILTFDQVTKKILAGL
ncbi:MAG TPA: nitrous oxide reductase accessory protein NosL [Desulfobulbaceae bacterium]|nr:nitrous oxide reductase accessory protein NosL [Desulfobulbaceae bacterium]